jgi:predicted HAD superfamily Cof-like phosphohydrolase
MSKDWVNDIGNMHAHYGIKPHVEKLTKEQLQELLQFRIRFLQEETNELITNVNNPEEIVDALIDICVVAIGTLDLYNVDAEKAWNEVLNANMKKQTGVKPSRPNPIIPDLIKDENWKSPSHEKNYGLFKKMTE